MKWLSLWGTIQWTHQSKVHNSVNILGHGHEIFLKWKWLSLRHTYKHGTNSLAQHRAVSYSLAIMFRCSILRNVQDKRLMHFRNFASLLSWQPVQENPNPVCSHRIRIASPVCCHGIRHIIIWTNSQFNHTVYERKQMITVYERKQ